MRNLRIIALIGLITFGLFATFKNGMTARARWDQNPVSKDSVSKWEKRVRPALQHVPDDVTVFGYVAEWDLPGSEYNIIDQETEYTLTQYALAPRMVQPGLEHEWIIGNFTKPGFRDWLDKNLPSYEIVEIGFGIFLIHRTSQ
ncbi:MAG: hypothetical protein EHM40_06090 [Chloroflexi bacterium]|nr:MAG: hypothetical protein EHM40_06090 [Chloroflexota bacterium]